MRYILVYFSIIIMHYVIFCFMNLQNLLLYYIEMRLSHVFDSGRLI